jgi:hypothetical protein
MKRHMQTTINLIANLGVIAGIVFLGFELKQNRDLKEAEIRHELSQGAIDYLTRLALDGELADIVIRKLDGETLTPAEEQRFTFYVASWFRYAEDVHYQYRQDLYDPTEFEVQTAAWSGQLNVWTYRAQWCETKDRYSPDFTTEFDALLTEPCDGREP